MKLKFSRGIVGTLITTAALATSHLEKNIPQEVITVNPERYDWIAVSGKGNIKDSYLEEKVYHNDTAWKRYQKLVKKRNSGELPDVDANNEVYFGGRYFIK